MGISTWGALRRLHGTALDRFAFPRIFSWARSLHVDLLAWVGHPNPGRGLRRKPRPKTCTFLHIASPLGRIILRVCLAPDLVGSFRDGNALARTDYPGCPRGIDSRFASLPDPGPAHGVKHLGSARWIDSAGPDIVCRNIH